MSGVVDSLTLLIKQGKWKKIATVFKGTYIIGDGCVDGCCEVERGEKDNKGWNREDFDVGPTDSNQVMLGHGANWFWFISNCI